MTNEERMLARGWAEAQIFHDRQNPAAAAEEWEKKSRHSGSKQGRIVRRYVTPMEEA